MTQENEIKELDALVSLIDEPNEEMFTEIRHKVISYGKQAIPILEEAWVNTMGDDDSDRIENLIEDIRRNDLFTEMDLWRSENQSNIWEGYSVIMRYINPLIELQHCNDIFEKFVKEIWLELNDNLTALEKIKVLNHILFKVNNIKASGLSSVKSDSFFLNKLIDQQIANPSVLGLFYIAIAQRLKIPVYGVDLPGHFIVAFIDDNNSLNPLVFKNTEDVLFYMNPGNNGAVFTYNEVRHYIEQMKLKQEPEYFKPASNNAMLIRVIRELIVVLKNEKNERKSEGLAELISRY